jgi:hypothetical protein
VPPGSKWGWFGSAQMVFELAQKITQMGSISDPLRQLGLLVPNQSNLWFEWFDPLPSVRRRPRPPPLAPGDRVAHHHPGHPGSGRNPARPSPPCLPSPSMSPLPGLTVVPLSSSCLCCTGREGDPGSQAPHSLRQARRHAPARVPPPTSPPTLSRAARADIDAAHARCRLVARDLR